MIIVARDASSALEVARQVIEGRFAGGDLPTAPLEFTSNNDGTRDLVWLSRRVGAGIDLHIRQIPVELVEAFTNTMDCAGALPVLFGWVEGEELCLVPPGGSHGAVVYVKAAMSDGRMIGGDGGGVDWHTVWHELPLRFQI